MRAEAVNEPKPASAAAERAAPPSGLRAVSRPRAFVTHLALSTAILGAVSTLIFFVWYPHPYFQATGAWNMLRVLIGVHLVGGPLLTLIVFKPGKRGLKLDLWVIAIVQLAALAYGTTVIYRERPYFTVFAIDRFYVFSRQNVDQAELADPLLTAPDRIGTKPAIGPLLVVATRPRDPAALSRLVEETVLGDRLDIEQRPYYWSAYAAEASQALARALPLAALKEHRPAAARSIERAAARLGEAETALAFLPVQAKNRDLAMIIDAATGIPLEVLDVDPWVQE